MYQIVILVWISVVSSGFLFDEKQIGNFTTIYVTTAEQYTLENPYEEQKQNGGILYPFVSLTRALSEARKNDNNIIFLSPMSHILKADKGEMWRELSQMGLSLKVRIQTFDCINNNASQVMCRGNVQQKAQILINDNQSFLRFIRSEVQIISVDFNQNNSYLAKDLVSKVLEANESIIELMETSFDNFDGFNSELLSFTNSLITIQKSQINFNKNSIRLIGLVESQLRMENCDLEHNEILDSAFISATINSSVEIINSLFQLNQHINACLIQIKNHSQLLIENTIIQENSFDNTFVISSEDSIIKVVGSLIYQNSEIRNISTQDYLYSFFLAYSSSMIMTQSEFTQNTFGGGCLKALKSTINLNSTLFGENIAQQGVILRGEEQTQVQIKWSQIKNNTAQQEGLLILQNSQLEILNSSIYKNVGANNSLIHLNNSTLGLNYTIIRSNEVKELSLIRAMDSMIVADNLTMHYNTANKSQLVYLNNSKLELIKSSINDNQANEGLLLSLTSTVKVDKCQFSRNQVEAGSILDIQNSDLNIQNSIAQQNSALLGGFIYLIQSNMKSGSNKINKNVANYGGAIYAEQSIISLYGDNLQLNVAKENGGALYLLNQTTLQAQYSKFLQNQAKKGGAIYATNDASIQIENTEIASNSASKASIIWIQNTNQQNYFKNVKIANNTATYVNAQILNAKLSFENIKYQRNLVKLDGFQIIAQQAIIKIKSSEFTNLEDFSGFIQSSESSLEVDYSNFKQINTNKHLISLELSNLTLQNSQFSLIQSQKQCSIINLVKDSQLQMNNNGFTNLQLGSVNSENSSIQAHNNQF